MSKMTAGGLICLLVTACASGSVADTGGRRMCQQLRAWEAAGTYAAYRVAPTTTSDDGGARYEFELGDHGVIRRISADCGSGNYSECEFEVMRADGRRFGFEELSRFALIKVDANYFLVYRIIGAEDALEKAKRRVVKVADPPQAICNEIGDYAELM